MKKALITFTIAILTGALAFADSNEPDSMYIHFTATDGTDSVVIHTLDNIDSIVYYAPEVSTSPSTGSTFTDPRDNHVYPIVTIGAQTWMAANLQATVAIVDTTGGTADGVCQTNDVFVWNNTDDDTYGKLYSYQAALKACPSGWHLPSDDEWTTLTNYLVADGVTSGEEGTALKATSGWYSNGNGTDNYGFTALPGGYCIYDGTHRSMGIYGYWWSSTSYWSYDAYARNRYLSSYDAAVTRGYGSRGSGLSVRCVRD